MKKVYCSTFIRFITLLIFVFSPFILIFPQKRDKVYDSYIDKYKNLAIDHMKRHKIPASITLAQGLLESGGGNSRLAQKANNHFGIKCTNDWKGDCIKQDDDRKNEPFRVYKTAEGSYEDHSLFLKRSRYSKLFELEMTDYTAWAKGLQKCGYATDKAYANKLISLIENYKLYEHDRKGLSKKRIKEEEERYLQQNYKHTPYKTYKLVYVIAQAEDSYEAIAVEFGFEPKDLYKYNEVPKGFPLKVGDIVYFQKKKNKADKPNYEHIVQIGESMHSISQRYGMKVKNLYKMNKKDMEYVPVEGDVLKLR